jgi:hypothetical protein
MTRPPAGRPRVRHVFWVAFAASALLSSLWALASPIFSVPDEVAHTTKAVALMQGQVEGVQVEGERHPVVEIPDDYSYTPSIHCFVQQPNVSAECATPLGSEGGLDQFGTWVSANNPLYYALVGWPSLLLDGNAGVYAMRIVSALLSAVFFGWAAQLAFAARRARWMPAAVVFLLSPMILYFSGAVNPQGLEVAAAGALWVGTLRLLEKHGRPHEVEPPRWYLWLVVTLAVAALANARSTGPLWVVIVVGVCLLAVGWPAARALFSSRVAYPWIVACAASGLFSVWWTLKGGSLSGEALESEAPLVNAGFLDGVVYMVKHTPAFITQSAGYFGWFDTPMPPAVTYLFFIAFGLLVAVSFVGSDRRGRVVISLTVLLAILVPVVVQAISVGQTGIIWQGRYALFLYIGVVLLGGWLLSQRGADARPALVFTRVTAWTAVVVSLAAVVGVVEFVLALHRFSVGLGDPLLDMFTAPAWQPPLGTVTLSASFALVMAGFAAWLVAGPVRRSRLADVERVDVGPARD